MINTDNNNLGIVSRDIGCKEIDRLQLPQNDHKQFVVKISEYEGYGKYVDVRSWVRYGKDTEFHPSKHGFRMRLDMFINSFMPQMQEKCNNYVTNNQKP